MDSAGFAASKVVGRTIMIKTLLLAAAAGMTLAGSSVALAAPSAIVDPPRDAAHPSHNQQLLIPSHGVGLNALLFVASGKGPHRTVILAHGLPGNERNLDLAQAMRRAGWDVLTFTYRGAWGSPGDFSIANAMEDTQAALDFARSADGAKLGIDTHHLVLAGHSRGGATAMMTAAHNSGLDGLVLIDAWNIALGTSKGDVTRDEMIQGFDDFGNSLHGATPASVADEVIARRTQWDLVAAAQRLRNLPVLTVTAKYGGASENVPTTAALRRSGARLTAMEMTTDHSFADHRIALSQAVVGWLNRLRARP
jgi:pimeloyl-ACP methyl ester carboxylesterase